MADNWIEAMIEREAIPKSSRKDTLEEFCGKWDISVSTYYYQSSKPENWKRILETSLVSVKKECPEVLEVLATKAKSGDMKAVDMYLNYVVQLAKNLDIKTDGKALPQPLLYGIFGDNSNQEDSSAKQED